MIPQTLLLKIGIGVAVAVILAGAYYWQIRAAYNRGVQAERIAAERAATKRIENTRKNNEKFKKLSARDRCLAFMRDSGLPEHHCN